MPVLEVEHLTKRYGMLLAVNDLNLTLERGEVMGFVGPNGAGKTTTIKIICTLLQPTSGSVRVDGLDVSENPMEVRRRLGYMPDFFGVYNDLKVWEYLDFFANAYRIPASERARAADDVLELTDLTGKREAYVESLSRGMKQRLCLAKTLLPDPELLVLDEPASGLDPRARIEVKEILKELGQMGKTILISSHILPELADFCNKLAVIEAGKLVVAGSVDEISRAAQAARLIRVRVRDRQEEAADMLSALDAVTAVSAGNGDIRLEFLGEAGEEYHLVNALVEQGYHVLAFTPETANLEDVFMRVTKGHIQ